MKELRNIPGTSLLLVERGKTLCGYKIDKQVYRGILSLLAGEKAKAENLLFEKQELCDDGIRFTDGQASVHVQFRHIHFSFQVDRDANGTAVQKGIEESKCFTCGAETPEPSKTCEKCEGKLSPEYAELMDKTVMDSTPGF